MQALLAVSLHLVSEELNSVETILIAVILKPFLYVSEELNSVETEDLVLQTKKYILVSEELNSVETELKYSYCIDHINCVSEELNSVETK